MLIEKEEADEQDQEKGFIVPDDYLSNSEMNMSDSDADEDELDERRKAYKNRKQGSGGGN